MTTLEGLKTELAQVELDIKTYQSWVETKIERRNYLLSEIRKLESNLPATFTNQHFINAVSKAVLAKFNSKDYWQFIVNAGLADIAKARGAIFNGHDRLVNFSTDLYDEIVKQLIEITKPPRSSYRFSTKGKQILLDGKPFRFTGCNMRELAYYGSHVMPYANADALTTQMLTAQQLGMKVVRFFAPHQDFTTAQVINRVKLTLDRLQMFNLRGLVCLTDNKWTRFQPKGDTTYRGTNGVNPFEMYYESWYEFGYKQVYLPFVMELMSAIGNHPALFAVDIANEPQLHPLRIGEYVTLERVNKRLDFFYDVTDKIRKVTPVMVTSGAVSAWDNFELYAFEKSSFAKELSSILDFMTIHTYQDPTMPKAVLGGNDIQVSRELTLGIPVVLEEFGGLDASWLQTAIGTAFNIGISGVMAWGFQATEGDIGGGDPMGFVKTTQNGLPGHLWQPQVELYKRWA